MTYLVFALALLLGGYEALVRYHMRRVVAVRYNRVLAWWLRRLLPSRMRALSLWTSCYLLYPPLDTRGQLSVIGLRHEIEGHLLNPDQWAGHARLFPLMYLWASRRGYDRNKYEIQARAIAGQEPR